jgi:hypothetical protein
MERIAVFVFMLIMAIGFVSYASDDCEHYCDKYEYEDDYSACIDGCEWAVDAKSGLIETTQNGKANGNALSLFSSTIVVDGCNIVFETGDSKIYTTIDRKSFGIYGTGGFPDDSAYIIARSDCAIILSNRHIKVSGITEEIQYSSNSNDIVVTNNGDFIINTPGNFEIRASVRGKVAAFPIEATLIPIKLEYSEDEVIGALGLPDNTNSKFIRYAYPEYLDGIYYQPDKAAGMSVQHWFYDRFPDAIIYFRGQNFKLVKMKSWTDFSAKWYAATKNR